jgi:RimJ/RimL family protein N-acetyltransferase
MLAGMADDTHPLHADAGRIRPPLAGDRVRLRAIEEDDLPRLNELILDPEVLNHLDLVQFGQPVAGIHAFWESTRGRDDVVVFAIEAPSGEPIGISALEQINWGARTAVLGIWIGQPYWGKGYGTDAVRTICRFGFDQMNLQRVSLHVYETNPRGRAVYEKVGFKLEGTMRRAQFRFGRYVDGHVMGLLKEDLTGR